MKTTDKRSALETSEVRVSVQKLTLTMENHSFDVNDPFYIFYFLIHFMNKEDILKMSERKEVLAVPTYLADVADMHFRTNLSVTSRRGGDSFWPEAIQYLLPMYANLFPTRKLSDHIHTIKQKENDSEESYRNTHFVPIGADELLVEQLKHSCCSEVHLHINRGRE